MSSAVDIQIVSVPNLEKIESFFKDSLYRETIEISSSYNTRLCLERRLRLPFLDPQTRIAQNHSQLFFDRRQRMPGFRQGQIYTYPAPRWRKSRRQYLNKTYRFPERPFQGFRKEQDSSLASLTNLTGGIGIGIGSGSSSFTGTASPTVVTNDPELNVSLMEESSSLGAAGGDTSDSKDSQQHHHQQQQQQQQAHHSLKDEWFYDVDMNDVDSLEDPKSPIDDEYDYDPRYGSKKRKKNRKPGKKAGLVVPGESVGPGRKKGSTSKSKSTASSSTASSNNVTAPSTPLSSDMGDNASHSSDFPATPTSSNVGRKKGSTGGSTRGRRRTRKGEDGSGASQSPGANAEPPSFESAAAAVGVGVVGDLPIAEDHPDLRSYRKYL